MADKGTLYIVPTPIGNLSDITYRAVTILSNVAVIGAEDTRNTGKLLKKYDIKSTLLSYHKFNEKSKVDFFLHKLMNNQDVAIVSDSGTPGISDPAGVIIKAAIDADCQVCTLPGPTALVPALVSSGLATDDFYFAGFLPVKQKNMIKKLNQLSQLEATVIFYEAPHRIFKTLELIYEYFGDRYVVIARELSKIYESFYRNNLSFFLSNRNVFPLKGEFVVCCSGKKDDELPEEKHLISEIKDLISKKYSAKEISEQLYDLYKFPKNKVYELYLKIKNKID